MEKVFSSGLSAINTQKLLAEGLRNKRMALDYISNIMHWDQNDPTYFTFTRKQKRLKSNEHLER